MTNQLIIIKKLIVELFEYNNRIAIVYSIIGSYLISLYSTIRENIFGVPSAFVVLICILMFVDWVTSLMIRSKKVKFVDRATYTFLKFVMFFLWIWLVNTIHTEYNDVLIVSSTINFVSMFVLILVSLREFVSISNNIEKKYGNKPYLLKLIGGIFKHFENLYNNKMNEK